MNSGQTFDLARYRMLQARETLHEAEILYRESAWRGVINRAYYAMFYAILSLAVTRQVDTSKHSGVISFFDREFVKTEIFSRELSRKLHLAFERRQVHDYGELSAITPEVAQETLSDARAFVDAVLNYLETTIYPGLDQGNL